jgi:hypothetical protein
VEYWLNAKPEDPEKFAKEVEVVCEIYKRAQELNEQQVQVISTDEKTGIQALERAAPTLPMKQGIPERQENEYIRHGTQCLIGNFKVATGEILAATIGATRSEKDFAAHIAQTVATDPSVDWIFVLDQLDTHKSETLVRFVAEECRINEPLGVKGKSGVLKTRHTRASFLSDCSHRIRFVYTPKHTSWLNQIEIWFSILVRKLLKRGSFRSIDELKERIRAFIDYFNTTMAKPFKWTYAGRPLTV